MTVHDLGYRGWSGHLVPARTRAWVISKTGVRRAWQSHWLRRMMFFAWLPTLYCALGFFFWEQAVLQSQWREALSGLLFMTDLFQDSQIPEIFSMLEQGDLVEARHDMWAFLLNFFFQIPQAVVMSLMVGIITPSLISQDIRSRAFLLYFSRPVSRLQYIIGKYLTVWTYLMLITAVPALVLYLLGVLLSPQLGVISSTWDLPLRIVAATAVLVIPTASLALCLSSLTQESRIAGFAWFAIWVLGWFTYWVMLAVHAVQPGSHPNPSELKNGWWTNLSLYHMLGRAQKWVFGFAELGDVWISLVILSAITVISAIVLIRQVSSPMRA